MPAFCVVSNCEHKYTHSENVSFHKFPHHSKALLEKWIQFADRGHGWKPSRWSAICSRHFLPSNFRDSTTRKCLKKDAVPSITMKNFEEDLLANNSDELQRRDENQVNCRLCGSCCKSATTFSTNFEIYGMIQKCFPTFNIQQNDKLPKDLCLSCLQRLQAFSDFVDDVLRTQTELENKFSKIHPVQPLNPDKALKIKQEPAPIKVKQEISDGFQNFLNDMLCTGMEEEQEVEQKSNFSDVPFINSQEITNNCDIMEIINLEDAFIDIPDDEAVNEDRALESKVLFRQISFADLIEEHNYATVVQEMLKTNKNYKTEKSEESNPVLIEQMNPDRNIIVLNESIVKPVPHYDLLHCDSCSMQFVTEDALTEHKNLDHPTKECVYTECDVEFQNTYESLKHKTKVHRKKEKRRKNKRFLQFCPKCGKTFLTKLALNNHKKYICEYEHERSYECKYCSEKFKKWILSMRHQRTCEMRLKRTHANEKSHSLQSYQNNLPSNFCDNVFSNKETSFPYNGTSNSLKQRSYQPRKCNKFLNCLNSTKERFTDIELKTKDFINFVCIFCGKQFNCQQKLRQHCLLHSEKKHFVCEACGKSFRTYNNLYQHKITHSDVRRYKCNLCDKLFKRNGGLNQHKKAYHLKLKPHECPVCQHKFALKADMLRCKHSALKYER